MSEDKKTVFNTLVAVNVNDHTEVKNTGTAQLTYLSWPWAWSEIKKRYPDATYEIIYDPNTHLPYSYDPATGYMVYTSVTIEGVTHMMWLPVMDGNNRAMKSEPYTVKTKYKEIPIAAATMFDINKTIMRCLVKNLAMFGLGLYIYAGEDLPESPDEEPAPKPKQAKKAEPKPAPAADGLKPIAEDLPFTVEEKPQAPIYKCDHCGAPLKPYVGKDGKNVSLRAHAERSKQMFAGKIWCIDCINDYLGKTS